MTLRAYAVTCLSIASLFVLACDQAANSTNSNTVLEPAPFDSLESGTLDREMRGSLRSVDTGSQTIAVMVDGFEQVFSFSDATAVVGATDRIQGLTGHEGTSVAIRYRMLDDGRLEALRIQVE